MLGPGKRSSVSMLGPGKRSSVSMLGPGKRSLVGTRPDGSCSALLRLAWPPERFAPARTWLRIGTAPAPASYAET